MQKPADWTPAEEPPTARINRRDTDMLREETRRRQMPWVVQGQYSMLSMTGLRANTNSPLRLEWQRALE